MFIRIQQANTLRGYRLLLRQGALDLPHPQKKGFAVLLAFYVGCFWGILAFLVSGFVFCSVLLAMAGDQRRSEREMCHQRRICFAAPAAVVVVVFVAAILVAAPREWNYYILPL